MKINFFFLSFFLILTFTIKNFFTFADVMMLKEGINLGNIVSFVMKTRQKKTYLSDNKYYTPPLDNFNF